ncbi:hypothetical protein [uncultured Campylobacter sp.]|uniref:hypothetical protein n=1 Tax=uncultured Campylobacter sp. TaxID=218934 RepID=UPI002609ADE4|nr:hypothetical protein [uncultured Campylobacter sp.]
MTKFYLVPAFLSIVPTSTTASFGVKFHLRSQPVFNRAACFVAKFYHYPQSALNRRSFISKRLLETKPAAAIPPCFYFVSTTACEPQILKFNPRCFAPNFAKILLATLQNPIFYPKPRLLAQNSRDKIYAAFRLCTTSF